MGNEQEGAKVSHRIMHDRGWVLLVPEVADRDLKAPVMLIRHTSANVHHHLADSPPAPPGSRLFRRGYRETGVR